MKITKWFLIYFLGLGVVSGMPKGKNFVFKQCVK